MMRTQCQTPVAQRGASSSLHSLSSSAMSPLSTASLALALLLILAIPVCKSAPVELQQAKVDQNQLLSQIDDMCSSYLSADLPFQAPDVLREICFLMLVQKSKDLKARENSKRSSVLHPLLQLVPQLHTRRERGVSVRADLQGPGGIQSRGYFLYRPRNGRRSLEYD
ncbi:neuromedin-U [Myripristis murdjan]|uniref:neuromedin-U n=1 Tax=Myripristis murdjan TaxID=586833 RepID=UPI0011762367|nr:neuromedin-U [Myripristis murdjan]